MNKSIVTFIVGTVLLAAISGLGQSNAQRLVGVYKNAKWVEAVENASGSMMYVDTSSLKVDRKRNVVFFAMKTENSADSEYRYEIGNCDTDLYFRLHAFRADAGSSNLVPIKGDNDEIEIAAKGMPDHKLLHFACGNAKSPSQVAAKSPEADAADKVVVPPAQGGDLNGKAISLPEPNYPAAAKAIRAAGTVEVQVLVNENGDVISATALNGHPLLRSASETAARSAKFRPTVVSGKAVKMTGILTYTFPANAPKVVAMRADVMTVKGDSAVPSGGTYNAPATSGVRPVPKTVSGGVLNGKATSMPKPEYPAAARAVKASGAVSVQVTIDHHGNVISASAVNGHPLLRSAAESAARGAKFSPTLISGQPVNVTGVIVYNFVP